MSSGRTVFLRHAYARRKHPRICKEARSCPQKSLFERFPVKFLSKGTCFDRNLRVYAGGVNTAAAGAVLQQGIMYFEQAVFSTGSGNRISSLRGQVRHDVFLSFFTQSNLKNRPFTAILLFSNGFYFFINDNETGSDYGEL